ncbi:MAG: hypothetical protein QXN56_06255 [Candidatus Hadarchaeum sp.]
MYFLDFDVYRVCFLLIKEEVQQGGMKKERKLIAVFACPEEGRKPLARAVLGLPFLIEELAARGVKSFDFARKFSPDARTGLSKFSPVVWAFYGDIRAEDLVQAREAAFAKAAELGLDIPPVPEPDYEVVRLGRGQSSPNSSPSPDKSPFA